MGTPKEHKTLDDLLQMVLKFREERDWKKFHNPKDSSIGLALEAAEVMEHFLFKSEVEMQAHIGTHREDIADELADVLYWVLLMAHDLEINLPQSFEKKLEKSAKKYPIEKAKGSNAKYTEV